MKTHYRTLLLLTSGAVVGWVLSLTTGTLTVADMPKQKTSAGYPVNDMPTQGTEEIYQKFEKKFGMVPNVAKVMATSPALLRSYAATQEAIGKFSTLSAEEINVVQLAIAVENECYYCTAAHSLAGQMQKTPANVIEAIRLRHELGEQKYDALRDFAVEVYHRHGRVTEEVTNRFFEAGYNRQQALDVVANIAAKVMTNYTNGLAHTEVDAPFKPFVEGLPFAK